MLARMNLQRERERERERARERERERERATSIMNYLLIFNRYYKFGEDFLCHHHKHFDVNLQNYWYCYEELPRGCQLLSVVDLLPVSEPPSGTLITRRVRGTFQVMEHDVHTLWGGRRRERERNKML